ncbi:hypothetical protein [Sunxiuqinia sp. sy24]|uniref:hypothetical protein n=1 Tax=Sunxiuqinia sp. sy24 TaxID=3461495 RepID=UPI00404653D3
MRYLVLLVIVLMTSCGIGVKNNSETEHICCANVEKYIGFSYEFAEKQILKVLPKDTIFEADVVLNISKEKFPNYFPLDSVLCYCLAICKQEKISYARFYRDYKGYEIAQEYKIGNFSQDSILSKYYGNIDWITKHMIASFKIEVLDDNWFNKISSDFLATPNPRRILTKSNSENAERLILKKDP